MVKIGGLDVGLESLGTKVARQGKKELGDRVPTQSEAEQIGIGTGAVTGAQAGGESATETLDSVPTVKPVEVESINIAQPVGGAAVQGATGGVQPDTGVGSGLYESAQAGAEEIDILPDTQAQPEVEEIDIEGEQEVVPTEKDTDPIFDDITNFFKKPSSEEEDVVVDDDLKDESEKEDFSTFDIAKKTASNIWDSVSLVMKRKSVNESYDHELFKRMKENGLQYDTVGNRFGSLSQPITQTLGDIDRSFSEIDSTDTLTPEEKINSKNEILNDAFRNEVSIEDWESFSENEFNQLYEKYIEDYENKVGLDDLEKNQRELEKIVSIRGSEMRQALNDDNQKKKEALQIYANNRVGEISLGVGAGAVRGTATEVGGYRQDFYMEELARLSEGAMEQFNTMDDMVVSQQKRLDTHKSDLDEEQYQEASAEVKSALEIMSSRKERVYEITKMHIDAAIELGYGATDEEISNRVLSRIQGEGKKDYVEYIFQDSPQEIGGLRKVISESRGLDTGVIEGAKDKARKRGADIAEDLQSATMGFFEYSKLEQMRFKTKYMSVPKDLESLFEWTETIQEFVGNEMTSFVKEIVFDEAFTAGNKQGYKSDMDFLNKFDFDEEKGGKNFIEGLESFTLGYGPELTSFLAQVYLINKLPRVNVAQKLDKLTKGRKYMKGARVLGAVTKSMRNFAIDGQLYAGAIQANIPQLYNDTGVDFIIDAGFGVMFDLLPSVRTGRRIVRLFNSGLSTDNIKIIESRLGRKMTGTEMREVEKTTAGLEKAVLDAYEANPEMANDAMKRSYVKTKVRNNLPQELLIKLQDAGWDALSTQERALVVEGFSRYKAELDNTNINVADMIKKDIPIVLDKFGREVNPVFVDVGPFSSADNAFGRIVLERTNDVNIPRQLEDIGILGTSEVYQKSDADFIIERMSKLNDPNLNNKTFEDVFTEVDGGYVLKSPGKLGIVDNRTIGMKISDNFVAGSKSEQKFFDSIEQVAKESNSPQAIEVASRMAESGAYKKIYGIMENLVC